MALKPNSWTILNYVRDNDGADITAQDIVDANLITENGTPFTIKQVNGIITRAFQMVEPQLMYREEGELPEDAPKGAKPPKYIRLTDAGREYEENTDKE